METVNRSDLTLREASIRHHELEVKRIRREQIKAGLKELRKWQHGK